MPNGTEELPKGALSLTYHLVHDQLYTDMWLDKNYDDVFKVFDIPPDVRKTLLDVNARIGGAMSDAQATALVDEWLAVIRDELTPKTRTLW